MWSFYTQSCLSLFMCVFLIQRIICPCMMGNFVAFSIKKTKAQSVDVNVTLSQLVNYLNKLHLVTSEEQHWRLRVSFSARVFDYSAVKHTCHFYHRRKLWVWFLAGWGSSSQESLTRIRPLIVQYWSIKYFWFWLRLLIVISRLVNCKTTIN